MGNMCGGVREDINADKNKSQANMEPSYVSFLNFIFNRRAIL